MEKDLEEKLENVTEKLVRIIPYRSKWSYMKQAYLQGVKLGLLGQLDIAERILTFGRSRHFRGASGWYGENLEELPDYHSLRLPGIMTPFAIEFALTLGYTFFKIFPVN